MIGLWCERAQVSHLSCLILPERVRARDYCGSLVNVITAYAFLREAVAERHKAIVITAGSSATGQALAALARRQDIATILLGRSIEARERLRQQGAQHVVVASQQSFEIELGRLAAELGATAVFDGVGGELISRIAPHLPMSSTIYFYGFLGGAAPISFPSALFMAKNLIMKRFSNFDTPTVKDPKRLAAALSDLEGMIDEPMFRTRIGREFTFEQIDSAMAYESPTGAKAILVA